MLAIANAKDVVQLLQSEILGLRQQEVTEDPAENIPGGVPTESTCACEGGF